MSSIAKYFSILPLLLGAPFLAAQETIDFRQHIEPILKENCLKCHGPKKEESGFRVDRKATLFGGGGSGLTTIVPGSPTESYLIELVRESDEEDRMPYEKDPLPEDTIVLLEKWIAAGAMVPRGVFSTQKLW